MPQLTGRWAGRRGELGGLCRLTPTRCGGFLRAGTSLTLDTCFHPAHLQLHGDDHGAQIFVHFFEHHQLLQGQVEQPGGRQGFRQLRGAPVSPAETSLPCGSWQVRWSTSTGSGEGRDGCPSPSSSSILHPSTSAAFTGDHPCKGNRCRQQEMAVNSMTAEFCSRYIQNLQCHKSQRSSWLKVMGPSPTPQSQGQEWT